MPRRGSSCTVLRVKFEATVEADTFNGAGIETGTGTTDICATFSMRGIVAVSYVSII